MNKNYWAPIFNFSCTLFMKVVIFDTCIVVLMLNNNAIQWISKCMIYYIEHTEQTNQTILTDKHSVFLIG